MPSTRRGSTPWTPLFGKRASLPRGAATECRPYTLLFVHKSAVAQIPQRLFDLFSGVHHERPIPSDRLVQRFSGNEQETNMAIVRGNLNIITVAEHNQPCMRDRPIRLERGLPFGTIREARGAPGHLV